MQASIFSFWATIYLLLWLLKQRPESRISRAAFTWIGPHPAEEERWASFQLRWAVYSFGWLCQFALVFSTLWLVASLAHIEAFDTFFIFAAFALSIGSAMALLAFIGFLVKAAASQLFGANPVWHPTAGKA
jgi:hypothetical protein